MKLTSYYNKSTCIFASDYKGGRSIMHKIIEINDIQLRFISNREMINDVMSVTMTVA